MEVRGSLKTTAQAVSLLFDAGCKQHSTLMTKTCSTTDCSLQLQHYYSVGQNKVAPDAV
jgi:hypothetical protein